MNGERGMLRALFGKHVCLLKKGFALRNSKSSMLPNGLTT